jgi:hypothetical protein
LWRLMCCLFALYFFKMGKQKEGKEMLLGGDK